MVLFSLLLKARLEGVRQIQLLPESKWYFQLQCQICRELHPHEIYLTLDSSVGGRRQKTDKTFVMSCKFCHRECSLNYIPGSVVAYSSRIEEFQPVGQFEGRGLSIVHWPLRDGFNVVTEAGTVFADQSLEGADVFMGAIRKRAYRGRFFKHLFLSIG